MQTQEQLNIAQLQVSQLDELAEEENAQFKLEFKLSHQKDELKLEEERRKNELKQEERLKNELKQQIKKWEALRNLELVSNLELLKKTA